LERQLRAAGIKTVHYVSPTVWAWRSGRVKTLRAAVDLLLGIFPFEVHFLRKHRVPVEYVGHPLARDLPLHPDRSAARQQLGLSASTPVLAVLPGSRKSEVRSLTAPFLKTAARCREEISGLQIVVPLVNASTEQVFIQSQHQNYLDCDLIRVVGDTHAVLAAADVVLAASGTATFEAMLCKRPMVVGYKLHWLTYLIANTFGLVKVKHIAIANILADERLAPEFIQDECNADNLTRAVMGFFRNRQQVQAIAERYRDLHLSMQLDTNAEAARAVLALLALDEN
jgi:lipid-A-disaccharide synthase